MMLRSYLALLQGALFMLTFLTFLPGFAQAQIFGGTATTESVCNFGMEQDGAARSCEVPIPFGCEVANFPGSDKPWTNISKGGNTMCRFDSEKTDWKRRITGTCGSCKTKHCSARFSVMFQCGGQDTPPDFKPQKPVR